MTVTIPYKPREQFVEFHDRKERWAVLVVHRRAGKTVAAINDLIKAALTCKLPEPRFAYVAPTYAQAKDVAWSYLKRFTQALPNVTIAESELHVTLPNGARIRLYGADNYDRMRGIYLDGCVIDEPADMNAQAWFDVIRPALSDRQGWCVWIGTPKGRDDFYKLWRDAASSSEWFTMRLPASQSGILPQEELDSAKQGMKANPGAYEREYECSFETPVHGSIYGDVLANARAAGRVLQFEPDKSQPIFAFWDLGWNDSTAVWLVQVAGRDVCWLWHTEQKGKTAAEMVQILREAGLPIAGHFLPHDAVNSAAATGMNYRDALVKAGVLPSLIRIVPRTQNIWSGINALRDLMGRSFFRLPHCTAGVEALEAYHTKEASAGGTITKEPVHDWSSHTADAARACAEALALGMVATQAARQQVANVVPLYPDGSTVDLEQSSALQQRRSRPKVLSGHRPL